MAETDGADAVDVVAPTAAQAQDAIAPVDTTQHEDGSQTIIATDGVQVVFPPLLLPDEAAEYDDYRHVPTYPENVIPRNDLTEDEDKAVGVVLGVLCGDILGIPAEGNPRPPLLRNFEYGNVMGSYGRLEDQFRIGHYSDDGNATMALLDSLVSQRHLDIEHISINYGRWFVAQKAEGLERYCPGSASAVMFNLVSGKWDYRTSGMQGDHAEYGGSYANGGMMRIQPLPAAVAAHMTKTGANVIDVESLRLKVVEVTWATHRHAEAVDAAFILALANLRLWRHGFPIAEGSSRADSIVAWLHALQLEARVEAVRGVIAEVKRFFADTEREEDLMDINLTRRDQRFARVYSFQLRSSHALHTVLFAFCRWGLTDPEEAVINTVGIGGDTDTTASMVGGLCGALHGSGWLPRRWLHRMESEPQTARGFSFALRTARALGQGVCDVDRVTGEIPEMVRFVERDRPRGRVVDGRDEGDTPECDAV